MGERSSLLVRNAPVGGDRRSGGGPVDQLLMADVCP